MSDGCCGPGGDDSSPAGRRRGIVALVAIMLVGWGSLAAVLLLSR